MPSPVFGRPHMYTNGRVSVRAPFPATTSVVRAQAEIFFGNTSSQYPISSEQVDQKSTRSNEEIAMNDKSTAQLNGKSTVAADPNMKKLSPLEILLARLEYRVLQKIAKNSAKKAPRSPERLLPLRRVNEKTENNTTNVTHVKVLADTTTAVATGTTLAQKAPRSPARLPSPRREHAENKDLDENSPMDDNGESTMRSNGESMVVSETSMADLYGKPCDTEILADSSGELTKAKAVIEEPTIEEPGHDVAHASEPEEHGQDDGHLLENQMSLSDFEHMSEPEEPGQDEKSARRLNDLYMAYDWSYDDKFFAYEVACDKVSSYVAYSEGYDDSAAPCA